MGRFCVQQMHLSTIFYTKSAYVQSLPSGIEGILAIFGYLGLRKYHQMTFNKKYPDVKLSTIAKKKKSVFDCCGIKQFINSIKESTVVDLENFLEDLQLIEPDPDCISFEDLCDCGILRQDNPSLAILDRIDRFMSAFNIAHSVFRNAVNIPRRKGAKFKVFEGDQPSSYTTMKFQTKEGGKGGNRTIGINPYMLGFASDETVVDVADVSAKVGWKAWLKCCCSFGCLYISLIKQVLDSKSVLITTSRRIIRIEIMSPAEHRVLDPTSKYKRAVESFFEPCKSSSSETV